MYGFLGMSFESPMVLAPLAGISDSVFRRLAREQGASLSYTEMVSAKGLYYKSPGTEDLLRIDECEGPVGVQLFGSEPDMIAFAAEKLKDRPNVLIDINMGCPVPKVVNNGEGSALMKNPALAGKIIRSVSSAVSKPVTVKIRKGFDDDHINAVEMAKVAEENGAAAVAVHARTRMQYYSGKADWDIIRQVKEAVTIPVIGNGDVDSYESACRMLDETGCDGVMIGRAAQGNPWIFAELVAKSEGREWNKPTREDVARMILRHAAMLIECKGEYIGSREMRKHAAWYTKGYKGSSQFRGKLNEAESLEDLKRLMDDFLS